MEVHPLDHKINESARLNGGLMSDNAFVKRDTKFTNLELLINFNNNRKGYRYQKAKEKNTFEIWHGKTLVGTCTDFRIQIGIDQNIFEIGCVLTKRPHREDGMVMYFTGGNWLQPYFSEEVLSEASSKHRRANTPLTAFAESFATLTHPRRK